MNAQPNEHEPTTREGLTTEQLANAGTAQTPPAEPRTFEGDRPAGRGGDRDQPLFAEAEAGDLRGRWDRIQTGFVDEPRRAVEDADRLVAETMKRLAEMFADERSRMEAQWDRGDDIDTEDLRLALQRYRAFFGRLLAV
jgi:hypothetical protein